MDSYILLLRDWWTSISTTLPNNFFDRTEVMEVVWYIKHISLFLHLNNLPLFISDTNVCTQLNWISSLLWYHNLITMTPIIIISSSWYIVDVHQHDCSTEYCNNLHWKRSSTRSLCTYCLYFMSCLMFWYWMENVWNKKYLCVWTLKMYNYMPVRH